MDGWERAGAAQTLRISVDANSELSKLIAERVVVDARAAGLTLQTVRSGRSIGDAGDLKGEGEAQLVAWRVASLLPRVDLEKLQTVSYWRPKGGPPAAAG